MTGGWQVRRAREADIPELLRLMTALAVFERYDQAFAVTESVLRVQGFRRDPPDFVALVAEHEAHGVRGMLVFHVVPFALRARPTLFVKELYIDADHRGQRLGEALMRAAAIEARTRGCVLVKWQVARWNADGARFYERLGATSDDGWVDYVLDDAAIARLADGG